MTNVSLVILREQTNKEITRNLENEKELLKKLEDFPVHLFATLNVSPATINEVETNKSNTAATPKGSIALHEKFLTDTVFLSNEEYANFLSQWQKERLAEFEDNKAKTSGIIRNALNELNNLL